MAKQTDPIREQCQRRKPKMGRCVNDATVGVYAWAGKETDVDLDKPVALFCGEHKARLQRGHYLRNVRIAR